MTEADKTYFKAMNGKEPYECIDETIKAKPITDNERNIIKINEQDDFWNGDSLSDFDL